MALVIENNNMFVRVMKEIFSAFLVLYIFQRWYMQPTTP